MKLLETFEEEHRLIDQVIGAFRTWADQAAAEADREGGFDPADGRRFLRFFTDFVVDYHDHREEQILFETLVTEADLPRERGPVHALVTEHAEMQQWLEEMASILAVEQPSAKDLARLQPLVVRFSQTLWLHIDAENSVLYPESARRLRQNAVRELPDDRPMTDTETAACADGAALIERYPPTEDDILVRGEGCFMCRAYGVTCEGLEAEWWSELEWDDFFDR